VIDSVRDLDGDFDIASDTVIDSVRDLDGDLDMASDIVIVSDKKALLLFVS
jgi:hypothetical protein